MTLNIWVDLFHSSHSTATDTALAFYIEKNRENGIARNINRIGLSQKMGKIKKCHGRSAE